MRREAGIAQLQLTMYQNNKSQFFWIKPTTTKLAKLARLTFRLIQCASKSLLILSESNLRGRSLLRSRALRAYIFKIYVASFHLRL